MIRYIDKTDDKLQIKCPSCDVLISENIIKQLLGDENLFEDFESKRNAQLELSKNKISSQESKDLDGIDVIEAIYIYHFIDIYVSFNQILGADQKRTNDKVSKMQRSFREN